MVLISGDWPEDSIFHSLFLQTLFSVMQMAKMHATPMGVSSSAGSRPRDKGLGAWSSRPLDKGGGGDALHFSALQALFWFKNKGWPGAPVPLPPPLDPPLSSKVAQ